MAKSTISKKADEQSFESAIEKLTEIVGAMESDQLPLEELIVRYEEGTRLVQICAEKLKTAERRIEIITHNANGRAGLADFEPEAEATPKKSAKAETDVSLF